MNFAWFNKASTPKIPAGTDAERLANVEAGLRSLRLEWEDTYERVMRALRRLNKRAQDQRARDEREEAETSQDAPGPAISTGPALDPISAAIHARRSRGVPSGGNGR